MERTNISNLKDRLSAYLKKVQAGETVLVTDRNRPIARIEPIRPAETGQAAHLKRLEEEGQISPPGQPLPADFFTAERPKSEKSVLEALLEERAEGR